MVLGLKGELKTAEKIFSDNTSNLEEISKKIFKISQGLIHLGYLLAILQGSYQNGQVFLYQKYLKMKQKNY
jgi:hypothetical protein